MERLFLLLFTLFIFNTFASGQEYKATLELGNIDISEVEKGGEIIVPVRLGEKPEGKIIGFQLFIEYDHSIISWKGSHEEPLLGVKNFHKNLIYNKADWIFNDNGIFVLAFWSGDNSPGIEMNDGEIIFEYRFTYKGGLEDNKELELIWGTTIEQRDGKIIRNETQMYSELFDYYDLSLINGKLIK